MFDSCPWTAGLGGSSVKASFKFNPYVQLMEYVKVMIALDASR
jgi:hypothetical protein